MSVKEVHLDAKHLRAGVLVGVGGTRYAQVDYMEQRAERLDEVRQAPLKAAEVRQRWCLAPSRFESSSVLWLRPSTSTHFHPLPPTSAHFHGQSQRMSLPN
jgi:hypothetical protein